jgi:hypothetical protein
MRGLLSERRSGNLPSPGSPSELRALSLVGFRPKACALLAPRPRFRLLRLARSGCLVGALTTTLWTAGLVCLPTDALAKKPRPTAESAEDLLREAVQAQETAQFERSLKLLHRAREWAGSPELLGRIYLMLGVTYAIMEKEPDARQAFRDALTHTPDLRPDPAGLKPSILKLFRTVRREMQGQLVVTADQPGAIVLVDGREVGRTPLQLKVRVGAHRVEVRSAAGAPADTRRVIVSVGKQLAVSVTLGPLPTRPSRGRLWTWIAAGGAALTLIVGVGLGASAQSDYNEYSDPATGRARGEELAGSIRTKSTAANVMFGVAGAMAVASVVLFFVEGRGSREARRAHWLAPLQGRTAGLTLRF